RLNSFLEKLVDFRKFFGKLEKRLGDRALVETLLQGGLQNRRQLRDEAFLTGLLEPIRELGYQPKVVRDPEHSLFKLVIPARTDNGASGRVIDLQFVTLPEFKNAVSLKRAFEEVDQPPFVIDGKDDSTVELASRDELLDAVIALGKKQFQIQRYKGLGEMNPEQLWETTMDPEARSLLQVRIEDAVETDEVFTILMGDAVEPRRRFIEDNALDVKNLDV
ncbi:MAG: DNA gyrase subunit B, partial [Acidobacteriota bacterium]|nr:DNA gyrase subunit B [Acidobacteriota bacterium]